ncbi:hypothetical protein BLA60_06915 [Actinophytocola xinjiangensis]|uniref:YCII-related domain-containing protein n=1 Tax=Actinophytocola xinjiangensis TaxID=485602 RepID=A0A7Z0WQB2_9PSEU|nr:YciI family protein [Actinophytocola xinjiangensis]OLF12973.1 hypothetical protein BLA60_06915 [Actinophytocola xinjiangensis]
MPQFAVLIYDKEIPFEEFPPEILAGHEAVEGKVDGAGAKIVTAYATQPSATARTVRGDKVSEGPFQSGKSQLTGVFVIEARDIDHAAEVAGFVPIMDGAVEVRPLLGEE